MATADALLALLLPGPRHGYDLKRAHDEWFSGLRPLAFGQVYSTLARLQRDDLIKVTQTETADGPERTVYELTTSGQARARTWLADPLDPAGAGGAPADELIRKTLAAYHLHADPHGAMARQRTMHLRAMRALETASPTGLGQAVTRDHQRLRLDADLRWLELTGDRMRRQGAPGVDPLLKPVPMTEAEPDPDAGFGAVAELATGPVAPETASPQGEPDADLAAPTEGERP